ncbi:MAG TPA: PAS domain S-box protein [Anaerovoracaceae bacterium]|nr:PAS domain S-box protein [Anaerovoracaceae bacterium]
MTSEYETKIKSIDIRKQAEEALKGKQTELEKLVPTDVQSLVHELQVHQIELEMQNEELRRAQSELEDALNRYSDLYDFAPLGYFTFDKNGSILDVNLTGAKKLGIERGNLVNKPFSLYIAPDFKDVFYLHLREVFNAQTQGACELRLMDNEGEQFDVLFESLPVRDSDGNLIVRVVMSDITQRKKAVMENNLLASIIKNIPESVCTIDLNGNIISWNEGAEKMLGYGKEEIIGKPITITIPEKLAQKELDHCIGILNAEGSFTDYESVRLTKDGRKIPVEITAMALKDETENITGYTSIIKNITERKQAEEELHKLNTELEERVFERTAELEEKNKELLKLDKSKSDFMDTISHELRTPLTAIIGYSQLLLDGIQGELNDKQTKYTERILARGNHQLMLVNDVLDFSKLQSKSMAFNMESVSVADILSDTIEDEMPSIKQKGQEIILEVPDGVSDVHADKMRLKQVLTNLINNAIKFTPDNGKIVIKADNADEMVKISIIDNGIGIKSEDLERIFDNFVQVDQSNTRAFGGTGLGLTIVRDLMKHMGGSIEVESEYGKGSIFSVLMPQEIV